MNDHAALFGSRLEEKKAFEYLYNLIKSDLVKKITSELVKYAFGLFGKDTIMPILKKKYYRLNSQENSVDLSDIQKIVPKYIFVNILRDNVLPLLSKRFNRITKCPSGEMERRLGVIKNLFNLNETDSEILTMCYFLDSAGSTLKTLLDMQSVDLSQLSQFRLYAHTALNVRKSDITRSLSKGALLDACLLDKDRSVQLRLSDWCRRYLDGFGKADLSHEFFSRENKTTLKLSNFNISQYELDVVDTLLKKGKGVNILLYGEPGTGKTSFAGCLAKAQNKELFTIKLPDSTENYDKRRVIHGTISLADKNKTIIVVDDADDILNNESFTYHRNNNNSWINKILESHDKKVIWITKNVDFMESSTAKRFAFSVEFNKLTEKQRAKALRIELKQAGFGGRFDENDIQEISASYSVNAGSIVKAVSVLGLNDEPDKAEAKKKLMTMLKNYERLVIGRRYKPHSKTFDHYSLEGLNCSADLSHITGLLKKYILRRGDEEMKTSMSLLLYGMPGTGKSEFVYYLGHSLNKKVVLKRASDIQSSWLGETEQNIANSFRQAQDDESILFFDEADTFLFPRAHAVRSWEISFTNEILTQMESHRGIVIFATNDMEGLDHASLRRFNFKVEFKPLTPEGNLHFYKLLLSPLVNESKCLSRDENYQIQGLRNLTPGDFKVVKEQHLFASMKPCTHKMLIAALANETRYKSKQNKVIGFGAP